MTENEVRHVIRDALDEGASKDEIKKWVDDALKTAWDREVDDLSEALKIAHKEGLI